MLKKAFWLLAVCLLPLMAGGCVSSSKFENKAAEADGLSRGLQALQQRHNQLAEENNVLKDQLNKLNSDFARLSQQRDKLVEDRDELDRLLKSKSSSQSKTISDLRDKTFTLEKENTTLQEMAADSKKAKEEDVKSVSKTYEALMQEMKNEIAQGQVTITELMGKLTLAMLDQILFESGEAVVKPEGLAVLQRVLPVLKNVKDRGILIEGHMDHAKSIGSPAKEYPTPWELSAARAVNVTRYMEKQGIDPALLAAVAYGGNRPVADNGTVEGRAKNRRIAIIIQPRD